MDLKAGDAVCRGKYRLIRLLGTGGFAEVFEAENLATRRRVALKVVRGESAGEEVIERLRREAVVSSRVRHRNIVDVYDLEEEDGCWFLVMEYVRGETLRQTLDRTRLPADVATSLVISMMRGLSVMHQHGVVHRDIKPENIYLARQHDASEVVVKLLDFGICKVEQPDPELPPLTRAGTQCMGTPMYISPEQYVDSGGVDARADIYSLGVVLYECLTGQPPYDASGQRELMLKMLTTTPRLVTEICPELPKPLGAIVAKAMDCDAEQRFQTIEALIEALSPFAAKGLPDADELLGARLSLPSQPPSSWAAGRRPRRAGWLAAASALALAQASGIYWAITSLDGSEPGASLFSPHENRLAGLILPPVAVAARALSMPVPPVSVAVPEVAVEVFCEIPGTEIYVNGQRVGAVVASGALQLSLPPGLYRFEALRDGVVVASDVQLVQSGSAFELHLRASGAAGEAEPLMAPAPATAPALVSTARSVAPGRDHRVDANANSALTKEQLSDVVSAHRDELQRCYETRLTEGELVEEPVSIELELGVSESGGVSSVRTRGAASAELAACFEGSVRAWEFPEAAQPTQLRFPLVFRRAENLQLTSEQLSTVVARSKGMLQRCYTAGSYADRVVRLDVDMNVSPSGTVASVEIATEHPEIEDCVSKVVKLWRFPSAAQTTHTKFPVLLLPGA